MKDKIIKILKEVYDPEFPFVDIYTMWLIYKIEIEGKNINITMTLTTPNCPLADQILGSVNSAIKNNFPDHNINIDLTFDPVWSPKDIKDDDLKRMFE